MAATVTPPYAGISTGTWTGNDAVRALLERFSEFSGHMARISNHAQRLSETFGKLEGVLGRITAAFVSFAGLPRVMRGGVMYGLTGGGRGGGSGGGSGGGGGFGGRDIFEESAESRIRGFQRGHHYRMGEEFGKGNLSFDEAKAYKEGMAKLFPAGAAGVALPYAKLSSKFDRATAWLFRRRIGADGNDIPSRGEKFSAFAGQSSRVAFGASAVVGAMASVGAPDAWETFIGSLKLAAGYLSHAFIPMFVELSYKLQQLAVWFATMSDTTKGVISFIGKMGIYVGLVTMSLNLLVMAFNAASTRLWAMKPDGTGGGPRIGTVALGIAGGMLGGAAIEAAGKGVTGAIGSEMAAGDAARNALPPEAKKEAARLIQQAGGSQAQALSDFRRYREQATPGLQQQFDENTDVGGGGFGGSLWLGFKGLIDRSHMALGGDSFYGGKAKKAEAALTELTRLGTIQTALEGGDPAATIAGMNFRQMDPQKQMGILTSIRAGRSQPQYSSIEEAYKKIQIEALSSDHIQMALDQLVNTGASQLQNSALQLQVDREIRNYLLTTPGAIH